MRTSDAELVHAASDTYVAERADEPRGAEGALSPRGQLESEAVPTVVVAAAQRLVRIAQHEPAHSADEVCGWTGHERAAEVLLVLTERVGEAGEAFLREQQLGEVAIHYLVHLRLCGNFYLRMRLISHARDPKSRHIEARWKSTELCVCCLLKECL